MPRGCEAVIRQVIRISAVLVNAVNEIAAVVSTVEYLGRVRHLAGILLITDHPGSYRPSDNVLD